MTIGRIMPSVRVSMPHAALWVVQLSRGNCSRRRQRCFNAARGFVGGAAIAGAVFVGVLF